MDERTERLIGENAETEHMLLAPFRLVAKLSKAAALVVVCVIVFSYNTTGWVVGLGSMGISDRVYRASLYDLAKDDDGSTLVSQYKVLLGFREPPVSLKELNEVGTYYPPAGIIVKTDGYFYYPSLPDYCSPRSQDNDPGMRPSGWFNRSWTVFLRKNSRMRDAYITGAASMVALRVTLTALRMHRDPRDFTTFETGKPNSLCRVDPIDPRTAPPALYNRWIEIAYHLSFPDVPLVHMQLVSRYRVASRMKIDDNTVLISGMCLSGECDSKDLSFYSTSYADLFFSTPPLSPGQEHAVEVLNSFQTDEFWLKEAHHYGVYDDAVVKAMAAENRAMITTMIAPDRAPEESGHHILGVDEADADAGQ